MKKKKKKRRLLKKRGGMACCARPAKRSSGSENDSEEGQIQKHLTKKEAKHVKKGLRPSKLALSRRNQATQTFDAAIDTYTRTLRAGTQNAAALKLLFTAYDTYSKTLEKGRSLDQTKKKLVTEFSRLKADQKLEFVKNLKDVEIESIKDIFEHYAAFEPQLWRFNDPLVYAIQQNDIQSVQNLMALGADITHKRDYKPLLHHAIEQDPVNQALVEFLIEKGADVNETSDDYEPKSTPLALAIKKQADKALVECLIDKQQGLDDYIWIESALKKPLQIALESKNNDAIGFVMEALIRKDKYLWLDNQYIGKDPETFQTTLKQYVKEHSGELLTTAIKEHQGNANYMIDTLVEYGADVNQAGIDGQTPLVCAIEQCCKEIIGQLIAAKAEIIVDQEEIDGKPLLVYAMEKGMAGVALSLIDKGAKIQGVMVEGKHILTYAMEKGMFKVAVSLIDKGAKIQDVMVEGKHILTYAMENGMFEVAVSLIDKGAVIQDVMVRGKPILIYAIENARGYRAISGMVEVAVSLIDKGAEIDKKITVNEDPIWKYAIDQIKRDTVINQRLGIKILKRCLEDIKEYEADEVLKVALKKIHVLGICPEESQEIIRRLYPDLVLEGRFLSVKDLGLSSQSKALVVKRAFPQVTNFWQGGKVSFKGESVNDVGGPKQELANLLSESKPLKELGGLSRARLHPILRAVYDLDTQKDESAIESWQFMKAVIEKSRMKQPLKKLLMEDVDRSKALSKEPELTKRNTKALETINNLESGESVVIQTGWSAERTLMKSGHYMSMKVTKTDDGFNISIFNTNPSAKYGCITYQVSNDQFFDNEDGKLFLQQMTSFNKASAEYYQVEVPSRFTEKGLEKGAESEGFGLEYENCVTQGILQTVEGTLQQNGTSIEALLSTVLVEEKGVDYKCMGELLMFCAQFEVSLPPSYPINYFKLLQLLTNSDYETIFDTLSSDVLKEAMKKEALGYSAENLYKDYKDDLEDFKELFDDPIKDFIDKKIEELGDQITPNQLMALYIMGQKMKEGLEAQRTEFLSGVMGMMKNSMGVTAEQCQEALGYSAENLYKDYKDDLEDFKELFDDPIKDFIDKKIEELGDQITPNQLMALYMMGQKMKEGLEAQRTEFLSGVMGMMKNSMGVTAERCQLILSHLNLEPLASVFSEELTAEKIKGLINCEDQNTKEYFESFIDQSTPEMRQKLLEFMGYNHRKHTELLISVKDGIPMDKLPTASTCFATMELPVYPNQDTFNEKLTLALENESVFDEG